MANLNKVLLIGNLTRDVELTATPGGMQVAKIGLAVNRRWTGNDGERKEETTFIDCEAWGKTGENIAKFFSKGRPIFIEGRLKLDTWQDKESGQNRSKMKVVVEAFEFVDSKAGGGGGSSSGEGGYSKPQVVTRSSAPRPAPAADGPEHSDDIPF